MLGFHSENLTSKPQFREIRSLKNVITDNIINELENSDKFNKVFSLTCPNLITNIVIAELN